MSDEKSFSELNSIDKDADPSVQITDRRRFVDSEKSSEDSSPSIEPRYPTYIEELQSQLKDRISYAQKIQARAEELEKKMQEEIHDTKIRLERNFDQRVVNAKNDFVCELLSIFDNLDLALRSAENGETFENLLSGVKATSDLLQKTLHKHGIERIDAVGQSFNPDQHEAIDTIEVSEGQVEKVISQMRPGYRVADRLLRPALVRVGKAKASSL